MATLWSTDFCTRDPSRGDRSSVAFELLTRQEAKRFASTLLRKSSPKLVDELVPRLLTLGEVQRVLQQLLPSKSHPRPEH